MSDKLPVALEELIAKNQFATLGTFFSEDSRYPFCSLVQYMKESNESLILKTAYIAEHHKNLSLNPYASIFILDDSSPNRSSNSRITLLAECKLIEAHEVEAVRLRWQEHTMKTIPAEIENSFAYWRAHFKKARWIAGFGEMGWGSY